MPGEVSVSMLSVSQSRVSGDVIQLLRELSYRSTSPGRYDIEMLDGHESIAYDQRFPTRSHTF
jgi:hypothetical protein